MNTIIETTVDELLNIKTFKDECLGLINEIKKDNKIDLKDIPYFVSLITLIYYKNPLKTIKKENVKNVFKTLVLKLLKEVEITEHLELIDTLISSSLDIIFLNVEKVKQSILTCCSKSKQKKEEQYNEIVNNLKNAMTKSETTERKTENELTPENIEIIS